MNNNEKFFLKLLENVDYIDCKEDQEALIFYVDELKLRVKIPYSHSSDNFSIFIEQSSDEFDKNGDYPIKIIDFSFDSIDDIKNFLDAFYKKFEKLSNNRDISNEIDKQFDLLLKLPINVIYPYNLDDVTSEPYIENIVGNNKYRIDIESFAYDYGREFKTKPLQPLEIACHYFYDKKHFKFKKIIPVYAIDEYPILKKLKKLAKTSSQIKNLTDLQKALDPINTFNPKSNAILNSWILDIELENNEEKKPKNKIKV